MQSKWLKEETVCEWLGVSRSFLIKNRASLGVKFSYLTKNRVPMYNQESIEKVLEANAVENLIQQQTK